MTNPRSPREIREELTTTRIDIPTAIETPFTIEDGIEEVGDLGFEQFFDLGDEREVGLPGDNQTPRSSVVPEIRLPEEIPEEETEMVSFSRARDNREKLGLYVNPNEQEFVIVGEILSSSLEYTTVSTEGNQKRVRFTRSAPNSPQPLRSNSEPTTTATSTTATTTTPSITSTSHAFDEFLIRTAEQYGFRLINEAPEDIKSLTDKTKFLDINEAIEAEIKADLVTKEKWEEEKDNYRFENDDTDWLYIEKLDENYLPEFQKSWTEWLNEQSPEFIQNLKSNPWGAILVGGLSLIASGQSAVSAFASVSGKPASAIGSEMWFAMSPLQRTQSIIYAFSSLYVNYPSNRSFIKTAWPRFKKTFSNTFNSPKDFFKSLFSAVCGGDSFGANFILNLDSFIFVAAWFTGAAVIPPALATIASILFFASRYVGMDKALNIISSLFDHDAKVQLKAMDSLLSLLNYDHKLEDGTTLGDTLNKNVKQSIASLVNYKKNFQNEDLDAVLAVQEVALWKILFEKYQLKHLNIYSFSDLKNWRRDTHKSNESTPLTLDLNSIEQLQKAVKAFGEGKKLLLADTSFAQVKLDKSKNLFQLFGLNPQELTNIFVEGHKKAIEIYSAKLADRKLNDKDYDDLLNSIVLTVSSEQARMEANVNRASAASNPLFFQKTGYQKSMEVMGTFGRLVLALVFGVSGGAIFLQKGFEAEEKAKALIRKVMNGEMFSPKELVQLETDGVVFPEGPLAEKLAPYLDKSELTETEKALIGLPAGLASGLLYGISAADFPRLFFKVLPEAVKTNKISHAGVIFLLLTNFCASTSIKGVTQGELAKEDSLLSTVEKMLQLGGIFTPEQVKLFSPYINQLGCFFVNMRSILLQFEAQPKDPNDPTAKEVLEHHNDAVNHPVSSETIEKLESMLRKLSTFTPQMSGQTELQEQDQEQRHRNPLSHSQTQFTG